MFGLVPLERERLVCLTSIHKFLLPPIIDICNWTLILTMMMKMVEWWFDDEDYSGIFFNKQKSFLKNCKSPKVYLSKVWRSPLWSFDNVQYKSCQWSNLSSQPDIKRLASIQNFSVSAKKLVIFREINLETIFCDAFDMTSKCTIPPLSVPPAPCPLLQNPLKCPLANPCVCGSSSINTTAKCRLAWGQLSQNLKSPVDLQ